ncbi:hypothetical protein [Deinococcus soli (ex Cha et al. 2016)]|uniref:hypothetical protein n=1 Tax=Deinococcus soli (ex Cha et al. 2016) TaxID=1309411 RepID=UPI0016633771|nr:hypothetical protein [Deinococcus soli (ex Cha et al. 2016)]GGB54947.1 hypothetical protein GCM10008019_08320 [Deinococcus soli (ex Cha et al. 2016)]
MHREVNRLTGTSADVNIIYGQKHFKGRMRHYRQQFDWSIDPHTCIRIISHAHLPILLHPDAPNHFKALLEGADLIVVDEDPLFAILFSLGEGEAAPNLPWIAERCASAPSHAEAALYQLMSALATGAVPQAHTTRVTNRITGLTKVSFTGKHFWQALQRELTGPPEWPELIDALMSHAFPACKLRNVRGDMTTLLEQDWTSATVEGEFSNRFGLHMTEGDPSSVVFRADIAPTLRPDTPPIVILDAYAEAPSDQYARLFPHHDVTVEQFGEIRKLDVEVNLDLHIDRTNLLAGRQTKRRDHLMAETGRLASTHAAGTLILGDQGRVKYLRERAPESSWTLHAPTLDLKGAQRPIEFAYYFAGRGVNTFSGRHVLALNPPERPTQFKHHTMAALAPFEPDTRNKLAQHLRRTELLQMLHRGRQTRFEADDPARPKIILAFQPDPELNDYLNVATSTPPLPFRTHSPNPYHPHATRTLAAEIFELLGGVPHAALVALGLYQPTAQETDYVDRVKARLKAATHHKKRRAPVLTEWGRDPASLTTRFLAYDPLNGVNTSQVLKVINEETALAHLIAFSVPSTWTARNVRVYAETEGAAHDALRKLGGLKEPAR